jgi:hypothetical protein
MVWRRVHVPVTFTLRELHGVIQVAMGWEGIHLFQFHLRAIRYGSWEVSAHSPELTPTELLAVTAIAYLQPATRAELSRLAGKEITRDVIGRLKRLELIDRPLRAPEAGAPFAYVTTRKFLEVFGLATLRDPPDVARLEEPACLKGHASDAGLDGVLGVRDDDAELVHRWAVASTALIVIWPGAAILLKLGELEPGIVVASAGLVHARRDDPFPQGVIGCRAKQRAGALARHPRARVAPIENDRHAVVKAPHPIIRLADDDRRVRKVVAAIESAPMVP